MKNNIVKPLIIYLLIIAVLMHGAYSKAEYEAIPKVNISQSCLKNVFVHNNNIFAKSKAMLAFEAMLNDWKANSDICEIMSNCESAQYGYYDIDSDDIYELIILNVRGLAIFKYQNGQITRINWSAYSVLLENGLIKYYRVGGAPANEKYNFWEYDGISYNSVEVFERYDDNEDGVYDETDLYLHNGEEVMMQTWEDFFGKYSKYEEAVFSDIGVLINNEANSE